MSRDEKPALTLLLPHQNTNLFRIPTRRLELRLRDKILKQEPHRRLHPIAFELPQPDLIHDRCGDDACVFVHLRVRVRGEVADDLIGCDTHGDGAADGFAGDFSGDHVWVAGREAGEELQDGDLQVRGCVGVDAVVCFDHDEAPVVVCCGGEAGGAQAACVGG